MMLYLIRVTELRMYWSTTDLHGLADRTPCLSRRSAGTGLAASQQCTVSLTCDMVTCTPTPGTSVSTHATAMPMANCATHERAANANVTHQHPQRVIYMRRKRGCSPMCTPASIGGARPASAAERHSHTECAARMPVGLWLPCFTAASPSPRGGMLVSCGRAPRGASSTASCTLRHRRACASQWRFASLVRVDSPGESPAHVQPASQTAGSRVHPAAATLNSEV